MKIMMKIWLQNWWNEVWEMAGKLGWLKQRKGEKNDGQRNTTGQEKLDDLTHSKDIGFTLKGMKSHRRIWSWGFLWSDLWIWKDHSGHQIEMGCKGQKVEGNKRVRKLTNRSLTAWTLLLSNSIYGNLIIPPPPVSSLSTTLLTFKPSLPTTFTIIILDSHSLGATRLKKVGVEFPILTLNSLYK